MLHEIDGKMKYDQTNIGTLIFLYKMEDSDVSERV